MSKNRYQARHQNVAQMNLQMNAQYAVVRNSRPDSRPGNWESPWKRDYIGIMSYRKLRSLQRVAEDANAQLPLEARQVGGIISFNAIAISQIEGGVTGEALRTWISNSTDGKTYDVLTAALIPVAQVEHVDLAATPESR